MKRCFLILIVTLCMMSLFGATMAYAAASDSRNIRGAVRQTSTYETDSDRTASRRNATLPTNENIRGSSNIPEAKPSGSKDGNTIKNGLTIVIDPGHGGSDPGAVSNGLKEADINLAVALLVQDIIENAGINVIMTREDDKFISLDNRAGIANKSDAVLFVSIHTNAAESDNISGIETYCYKTGGQSEQLANYIQTSAIGQTGASNRGVKTANYLVLREADIPAALVEMGFITTGKDRELLQEGEYQGKLADGIAQGILDYLKK